ncbi:MAG: MFS transporter [Candidatus Bathyarchaeia archaeon]
MYFISMRFHVVTVYYMVSALGEFSFEIPYLAYYLFQSLGLGYSFLYMAVFALVFGLLDYPTGGLADRFGRKRTYALGLAFVGINYLIVASYTFPAVVVLAAFLAGFGAALQSGSLEAWITDELGKIGKFEDLDKVFGRGTSFSLVADVAAGIVGSTITFMVGYWWTIPTAGIIAVAAFVFAMIFMPENWGAGEREPYTKLLKDGAKWILGKKTMLFLGLAQTFFIAGAYSYWETLTPVYGERGIPEALFGLICSAMHLPAVVTTAYAYHLTRKFGCRKTVVILSWAWTGSCLLITFLAHPAATIALVIVLESLIATRHPIIEFWRNILIPSSVRATVLSGLSTLTHVGQSFALFILSPLVQVYGTIWGLLSAVALTTVSNLTLFFTEKD